MYFLLLTINEQKGIPINYVADHLKFPQQPDEKQASVSRDHGSPIKNPALKPFEQHCNIVQKGLKGTSIRPQYAERRDPHEQPVTSIPVRCLCSSQENTAATFMLLSA